MHNIQSGFTEPRVSRRAVELQRELNVSLVVYFYTDWCSYCRALDEQYVSDPSVHRALQRTIAVRINLEYGVEERQIAEQYGVTGYPAFLIMDHESARPRTFSRSGKVAITLHRNSSRGSVRRSLRFCRCQRKRLLMIQESRSREQTIVPL